MKSYEEVAASVFRRAEEYTRQKQRRETALRRAVNGLAVLALILGLTAFLGTGYVLAAGMGYVEDFFGIFEERSGTQLNRLQQEFIEEAAAQIGESVTCSGVTVTVRSAITDGNIYYIYMDIEAPEEISLEALNGHGLGFDHTTRSDNPQRYPVISVSSSCIPVKDHDGKANTISMILRTEVMTTQDSGFNFADGYTRTLTLENLFAYLDTYPFSQYIIAKGVWSFRFEFAPAGENAQQELELLSEPVICFGERMSGKAVGVNMYSIRLGALGMTFRYSYDEGLTPEAVDFGDVEMVMRDGSVIMARPRGGVIGSCMYLFDTPVVFSQISHIVINGSTKVPVPQPPAE